MNVAAALGVLDTGNGMGATWGDLDNDGFPGVLAGFATGFNSPSEDSPDKVFLNPGNENNWFNIRLEGVQSNRSAVGARLELKGAWGPQIREVRAGESYGINNSIIPSYCSSIWVCCCQSN